MSNRLEQLLHIWERDKEQLDWVLATVIETAGSSYRKPGAMMFINSLGQYYGLISGGCLEADVMRNARKCWETGESQTICYDMREEDDIGWQLGIGCGGMVKILLQPINEHNDFLQLPQLKQHLDKRQPCFYQQKLQQLQPENSVITPSKANLDPTSNNNEIVHNVKPAPLITIIGGGADAIPLAKMADVLGWKSIIVDPRISYARPNLFPTAKTIVKKPLQTLGQASWLKQTDVLIIMTHNVSLDAEALLLAQKSEAAYVGLLGPKHRTEKVLKAAGLVRLVKPLSNPVGLDIGGELPEAIALSILSEAQAVLEGKISIAEILELKNVS